MRVLFVLLGLVVLVVAALMIVGFIDIDQTRPGRAPAYRANVGHVDFGTEKRTVQVPTVSVQKPADNAAAANAQ